MTAQHVRRQHVHRRSQDDRQLGAQEADALAHGAMPRSSMKARIETLGSQQFQRQFRQALRELGYVNGQSIRFEFRSDQGKTTHLPELAAELVRLRPNIIVAWLTPAASAARQATREIPIVIALAGNPVETGLAGSLARPGGNVTGIAGVGSELLCWRYGRQRSAWRPWPMPPTPSRSLSSKEYGLVGRPPGRASMR
jgi:hypothetical protein